jgi:tRNA U34 5-carboxymethylaminomethyl modifying GTPase MnmE/TrmE
MSDLTSKFGVVALVGRPNAGKSTLLNRIARREAAIVSPIAGTTRDVIEVHLDLDGLPVTLLDTAGIRETDDPVELEGVRRARERAAAADLVLWLEDANDGPVGTKRKGGVSAAKGRSGAAGASRSDAILLGKGRSGGPVYWLVRNKTDLVGGATKNESEITCNDSNELEAGPNNSLKNIVNQELTSKTEDGFTYYESVFNISAVSGAKVRRDQRALTAGSRTHGGGRLGRRYGHRGSLRHFD